MREFTIQVTLSAVPIREYVAHDRAIGSLPASTTCGQVSDLLGFAPAVSQETTAGDVLDWNFSLGNYLCGVQHSPRYGWRVFGPDFLFPALLQGLRQAA